LQDSNQIARFEQAALPHLDAAYNLARWLTRNDHDAQDVVQETYLRALKFFDGFRGGDGRAWLLTIVRHTCYDWLRRNRRYEPLVDFEEELHDVESEAPGPEALLMRTVESQQLRRALEELPIEFREVVILRDLEGLSYKEIADIARRRLQQALTTPIREEAHL
jgi:RNA polymerase sigma factor (sigma-70 family)